MKQNGIVQNGN